MGNEAIQEQLRQQQDQEGQASAGSEVMLDLSEPITHAKLEWCLRRIANDPGESGTLGFKLTGHANRGLGPLQARLTGWLGLTVGYAMRDSNFSTVFIEGSGALRAGIDVGSFGSVGVGVSGKASVMEKWFASTADAAAFLHDQLFELHEATQALQVDEPRQEQEQDGHRAVFDVSAQEVGARADGRVKAGSLKAGAGIEAATRRTTFTDQEGETFESQVDMLRTDFEIEVPIGGVNVRVRYHRDQGTVAGSPTMQGGGGQFDRNEVDILLPFELLLKLAGKGVKAASPKALRSQTARLAESLKHVVELCFKPLQKVVGRLPGRDKLEKGLFSSIAQKLETSNVRSEVGLRVVWNDWSTAGEMEQMYLRALLTFNESLGYGMKSSLVGGVGVEGGYQRQTLLYEKLGTETLGYVQRQYEFETEDRPWREFVADNDDEIRQIVENAADPNHPLHIEAVEREFERGDHDAGLTALERYWDRQRSLVAQNRNDAEDLAEVVSDALSPFTFRDATRESAMTRVMSALTELGDDVSRLGHLIGQIERAGVTPAQLQQLGEATGQAGSLQRVFDLADIEVKQAPSPTVGEDAMMFEPMGA